jgi:cell division septum initiation protein DivIVA
MENYSSTFVAHGDEFRDEGCSVWEDLPRPQSEPPLNSKVDSVAPEMDNRPPVAPPEAQELRRRRELDELAMKNISRITAEHLKTSSSNILSSAKQDKQLVLESATASIEQLTNAKRPAHAPPRISAPPLKSHHTQQPRSENDGDSSFYISTLRAEMLANRRTLSFDPRLESHSDVTDTEGAHKASHTSADQSPVPVAGYAAEAPLPKFMSTGSPAGATAHGPKTNLFGESTSSGDTHPVPPYSHENRKPSGDFDADALSRTLDWLAELNISTPKIHVRAMAESPKRAESNSSHRLESSNEPRPALNPFRQKLEFDIPKDNTDAHVILPLQSPIMSATPDGVQSAPLSPANSDSPLFSRTSNLTRSIPLPRRRSSSSASSAATTDDDFEGPQSLPGLESPISGLKLENWTADPQVKSSPDQEHFPTFEGRLSELNSQVRDASTVRAPEWPVARASDGPITSSPPPMSDLSSPRTSSRKSSVQESKSVSVTEVTVEARIAELPSPSSSTLMHNARETTSPGHESDEILTIGITTTFCHSDFDSLNHIYRPRYGGVRRTQVSIS